jgi:hypothetical protein
MVTNLALPYVDLHLAPYSVVADNATEAVATANTAAVTKEIAGKFTSSYGGDVGQFRVGEEAADNVR